MRKALALVIFCSLLASFAGPVHALGFGRIGGSTTLGQPLNFSAIVRLDSDELLGNECVSAEVFSGENKLAAGAVRTSIEPGSSASDRLVRVTTSTLLDEPVVTVNLSVGCNARLSRKFVVFLDPPFINLAQTNAAELPAPAPVVEPPRGEAQAATPSTQSSAPPQQAAARAPAPVARVVKPRPPRAKTLTVNPSAAAAQAARAKKSKADDLDVAARMPSTGARLKLEAPVAAPGVRASESSSPTPLAAAASAASAAASTVSLEEQTQLAKERERLKALEDSLTRLRTETEATQRTLASLQTRLKGAESERFSNPLVYALAGLCAALVFAVAAMWRRYSLREAAWWSSPQADASAAPVRESVASNADLPPLPDEVNEAPTATPVAAPSPLTAAKVSTPFSASPDTMPLPATAEPPSAAPRRELSVEELIDLEQQAEFFVVLGQDEAAIDLLMGHLRSTGGSSPLPYLKLLEIYRRRGDSEAYNRTRERFNRRFNAYAPDWDSDPQQGRALEGYPEMVERLQALWSKPTQVIELLDAALFRRDQSEDTFDVPAYRELVLLYSVVRDLAEHDGGAPVVDLLLPIGATEEQADSTLTQPAPFVSTSEVSITELTAASRRPPALDLDISAVRAFERPVDLEMPDLGTSSNFLGLDDDTPTQGRTRKS